jgi:shikimate kinase
MRIFLVGYMGSGKSTFGSTLADALGIDWIDLDDELESRYKITIADFFAKYGEETFRELEHKLLTEISHRSDIIVSTGGGAPCYFDNMKLMNQSGVTVYLTATPELLISRIEHSARKRPVFQQMKGKNFTENLIRHLKSREPFYKQATFTIDAAKPDIEGIKTLILNYYKPTF